MQAHRRLSEEMEARASADRRTSSSDSDQQQQEEESASPAHWRLRLRRVLDSHRFQVCVLVLVGLDCALVIGQLLLDLEQVPTHEPLPATLHYLSLAILSLFLLELAVKVLAFGPLLLHHHMELFDGAVVVVSFALDIVFHDYHGAAAGLGLLVLLRFWRVARVLNGVVMSVYTQEQRRLHEEQRRSGRLRRKVARLQARVLLLEEALCSHGVQLTSLGDAEERPGSPEGALLHATTLAMGVARPHP